MPVESSSSSGFFTASESAAVAVVYAVIVEIFIHREVAVKKLIPVFTETAEMLGMLFLILILLSPPPPNNHHLIIFIFLCSTRSQQLRTM
jgi:hypothetical protein